MKGIIKNELKADDKIAKKWEKYSDKDYLSLKSYSVGTYLLETAWGQGDTTGTYYNRFCPVDPNTGYKCVAGCQAVALAQILRKWHCQVFPDGSKTYYPNQYFTNPLTVNFYNQDYDWDEMNPYHADDDNAELIYHCGVAIGVNYTDSSTWTLYSENYKVKDAMEDYFGFQTSGLFYKTPNENNWINMLKTDIDASRPIYYVGLDSEEQVSHAWVVDGYRADNTFHCNWGWSNSHGENDDWYSLSNLSPSSNNYNFSSGQLAILGAEPILDACEGLNGASSVCPK